MRSKNKIEIKYVYQRAVIMAALFVFIILTIPSFPIPQEEEIKPIDKLSRERARLNNIRKEIRELAAQVKSFETRETGVLEQVEKYQLLYNLRTAELRGVQQNLKTTELEIRQIKNEIDYLDSELKSSMEYLKLRIRAMYKLGKYNYVKILLSLKSPEHLKKGLWYLAHLAEEDRKRIEKLEEGYKNRSEKLAQLNDKRQNILNLKRLAEKKKSQIEELLAGKRNLLEKIRNSKRTRESALSELKKASARMEELLERLSSGAIDASVNIKMDIHKFKGLLPHPVSGFIKKDFGNEVHPVFKIKIPHNGLSYDVPSGTDVRCIFDGKVIYNKRFRGYGNLLIIDHGKNILSFYAHLLNSFVSTGDMVRKNQSIALSGESGSLEGPILYFEILKDGKPVDPMLWLQQRGNR